MKRKIIIIRNEDIEPSSVIIYTIKKWCEFIKNNLYLSKLNTALFVGFVFGMMNLLNYNKILQYLLSFMLE